MRYHYDSSQHKSSIYGIVYICSHPVYSKCTLFRIGTAGLAVIQQRFDATTKHTYWTELDDWLPDKLYFHKGFYNYFKQHAGPCRDGLYPTVTIRKIMWALRMKPLPKARWETTFDRNEV